MNIFFGSEEAEESAYADFHEHKRLNRQSNVQKQSDVQVDFGNEEMRGVKVRTVARFD